jgi:plastocyanin
MDRRAFIVMAGSVITVAAGGFAVGAAISSDDSGSGSGGGAAAGNGTVDGTVDPSHASHSVPAGSEPAQSAAPATGPVATATAQFEIDIAQFQFNPAEAVVEVGTAVTWTNSDTDDHSIISTDDLFTSSDVFANGESYTFVFTEPGTYPYTCGVHPFMEATVTVEG